MENQELKQMDYKEILKFSGAFIAWVIGSGFATGQEILRFFSSFGYASYGIVIINLLGFLWIGKTLMLTGYAHKHEPKFRHFEYYCGKGIGKIYYWATPLILFLIMSVLLSAVGSMLHEYYGLNHYIGALFMALLVWFTYMIGFERFVQIISKIGPVVIIFSLIVGLLSVFNDLDHFAQVSSFQMGLNDFRATPHWAWSAILYLSLDFLTGATYYTRLGASAKNRNSAKWGAIIGSFVLIASITIMNTAILLNAVNAASLAIPTLYLAKKIGLFFGGSFSVILLLGMYSSCSATMWSICSNFFEIGTFRNKLVASVTLVMALVLGLLPFGKLVGTLYPLIGYYGLFYIACVAYKGISSRRIRF